jgi:hypothetical protein
MGVTQLATTRWVRERFVKIESGDALHEAEQISWTILVGISDATAT